MYNPREPNDRLLLGVKGTLSEAELFTLRTRLFEGRWNKRLGKGCFGFPCVGLCVGGGRSWVSTPTRRSSERLSYVFDSFCRLGVVQPLCVI